VRKNERLGRKERKTVKEVREKRGHQTTPKSMGERIRERERMSGSKTTNPHDNRYFPYAVSLLTLWRGKKN